MSSNERQFILRWILWAMCNLKLTSDKDFVEVATLAVMRYPQLQCSLNKGVVSVFQLSIQKVALSKVYVFIHPSFVFTDRNSEIVKRD